MASQPARRASRYVVYLLLDVKGKPLERPYWMRGDARFNQSLRELKGWRDLQIVRAEMVFDAPLPGKRRSAKRTPKGEGR